MFKNNLKKLKNSTKIIQSKNLFLIHRPNTRKYMKSKRKKNKLKEYGNMTEMLAEEIKRISKISIKNKVFYFVLFAYIFG